MSSSCNELECEISLPLTVPETPPFVARSSPHGVLMHDAYCMRTTDWVPTARVR